MSHRSSSGAGKHPYLRPGFWDDPINQFWEKSDMYNKEKYRKQFNQLVRENGSHENSK